MNHHNLNKSFVMMQQQQFSFCKKEKDVFDSIRMNVRTICINHELCKGRVTEWCDLFSSLLETYSLQENVYIKNIRSYGKVGTNSHLVFRKDTIELKVEECAQLPEVENENRIYTNLQCFDNNNTYFKDLLYDSVTMSYHQNIHKRELISF